MALFNIPWVTPPGPANYRFTYVTAQQGDLTGGWTENFWVQATGFSQAAEYAAALYPLLAACKSQGVWMPFYRVTNLQNPKQVIKVRFPGATNPTGVQQSGPSVPTVKALISLNWNTIIFTTQWLGGLDSSNFNPQGGWAPKPKTTAAIAALYAYLATGNFGLRKVCPTNLPSTNGMNPQQFTINAAGQCTYVNHGLANGAIIRIGKFVNGLGVNGLWQISGVLANTFQLNAVPNGAFSSVPVPTKTAYWRLYQYQFFTPIAIPSKLEVPPGNNGVLRATEHRIGRIPNQYSGRRRKKSS